jgi:hypothetical protein
MVKYVLVIPQGGFNDCLCTILRAVEYCKTYNRTLLLHMLGSIYRVNFSDFFDVLPSIGCNIIYDINIINDILTNNNYSVHPSNLNNRLTDVLNRQIPITWRQGYTCFFSDGAVLDLPVDAEEDVVVFSACGSGRGIAIFQHLTPSHQSKQHCNQHLALLSDDNYLCIHVRNTDYKCDYQTLYSVNATLIHSFDKIYIATDDKHAVEFFKTKHGNVFNFTHFPETYYHSLHLSSVDPIVKMNDMICDIFIAANSKRILSNSKGGYIKLIRDCNYTKDFIMNKLK